MIPTFNPSGDVIFAEMVSPRIGRLERGDVVIAVPPQNPKLRVCKRIIGLVSCVVAGCACKTRTRPSKFLDNKPEGKLAIRVVAIMMGVILPYLPPTRLTLPAFPWTRLSSLPAG